MIATPTKYKFTVDGLMLMEEAGLFPPDYRIELLNGEIVEMSPIKSPHAYCVSMLNRFLTRELPDRYFISVQNPVQLSEHSMPQPDVLVAHFRPEGYAKRHIQATDAVLLIEVADSSYRYDHSTKLKAYAIAEVPEYWIVNIAERQVEVYTQPEEDYYRQTIIQKHPFATSLGPELDPKVLFG